MKRKIKITRRTDPRKLAAEIADLARNDLVNKPECYSFFLLALGLGLRATEIPLIRWCDLSHDSMEVPFADPVRDPELPKTRTVPVEPDVLTDLESLRPEGVNPQDYLVTCVTSTHIVRTQRHLPLCREAFKELTRWLRELGLPPRPIEMLRKLYGFKILSGDEPDSFTRAANFLGLKEEGN